METATAVAPRPASPAPGAKPPSIGSVIERSLSVWKRNAAPFSVVALAIHVPVFVMAALEPGKVRPSEVPLRLLVSSLVGILVGATMTAALTDGVLEALRGKRSTIGALFENALADLGGVLVVSLAQGLIVLAGLLLLVVPGLVAWLALYVAAPAVVVEDVGTRGALRRSRALTKGFRWQLLAIVLALTLVGAVVGVALGVLGAIVGPLLPHPIAALLRTAVFALATPLGPCLVAVAYHDLRAAKEGVDTAELVKVFE